jgi:hypothetical protein
MSDIIGELLMMSIAVLAFGVIAMLVLSYMGPSDTLHIDIDGWVDVNIDTVYLRHYGGESVGCGDIQIRLNIDGVTRELSSDNISAILGSSYWELGGIININTSDMWNITINENSSVNSLIIADIPNVIVFKGTLLGEEMAIAQMPTPTPTPTPGVGCPLSWWRFDESSGDTAVDSSYGDNDGIIGGATRVPGISGSALRFDNVSPSGINYCYDYVTCGNAENLRFTDEFTLEAWVKVNSTQPDHQYGRIIDKFSSRYEQGYSMSRFWRGPSDLYYSAKNTVLLEFYADDVNYTHYWTNSTTIITDDTWHYVVGTYNGTALKIYIDGILEGQTDTKGETIRVSNNLLMIGCSDDNNVTQSIRAVIDEVAVCGEALTANEILEKYNNSKPNRDPISWWKFNENSGPTVYDCIDDNDGTIHGAQRTTGVEGGALFFNGSEYVSVPVAENLNMGNSDYTIEVWAWVDESVSYSDEKILVEYGVWWPADNSYRNGTYQITSMNDTNFKTNFVGRDSANGSEYNVNWTDSNWHHLVGVFNDRENRLYTYYDGVQCSTTLENDAPSDNNNPLFFGSRNGTEMFFVGKLDDIKIYNVSLTPEEIQEHYNSGKPKAEMVAQWHFDENTNTTAYDSKGSNNGDIRGPTWTTGVRGSALSFDGFPDYVTIPDDPSLDLTDGLTLMAWINTSGGGSSDWPRIISKRWQGPYELILNNTSGCVQLVLYDTDGTAHSIESSTNVMNDTWHLVTGVWDATTMRIYIDGEQERTLGFSGTLKTSNDSVFIGSDEWTDFFIGLIDEVTIYSGSLTAKEIKTYYIESNPAYVVPPVSLWHFDENSGTTATDSEDSNNGTISASGLWVSGINGSALDLEADSYNYININHNNNLDITSNITIEAWVKPESLGDWDEIVSKRNDQTGYANYILRFSNTGALQFYWKNSGWQVYTADGSYNTGQWYHIIATKSGTALPVIYINGSEVSGSCTYSENSCDCLNAMLSDSNDLNIGAGIGDLGSPDWFFDGIIDEVSVYDSILTADEVLTRYNDNKP